MLLKAPDKPCLPGGQLHPSLLRAHINCIQHFANLTATIYLDVLLLDGIALPDHSMAVSYLASWYIGNLDAKSDGMVF